MTPKVLVGSTYGPVEARVDADAAVAYALATNDPNPAYLEGGVVPPLYTVALILPLFQEAMRSSIPQGAITGVRSGVHSDHRVVLHAPVQPGATLRCVAETHSAVNTKAGTRVTQRVALYDTATDRLAVEHYWSTLFIGGTTEHPAGPDLPDTTFPEDARSRPLGRHTIPTTRDQTFRYAGASTDHAAFHIDDAAAVAAGFPRKFLQGLCTFAMCSQAVITLAADGDPLRLATMAARFSAPVFPGDDVEVDVYDVGPLAEGGRAVAFEASSAGRAVIKHGRAELRP